MIIYGFNQLRNFIATSYPKKHALKLKVLFNICFYLIITKN